MEESVKISNVGVETF